VRCAVSNQTLLCVFFLFIGTSFAQELTNNLTFSQPSIANSQLKFLIPHEPKTDLAIEVSTNLMEWSQTEFYSATSTSSCVTLTKPVELTSTVAFYRAIAQPIYAPLSLDGLYVVFTNSEFKPAWYFGANGSVYEYFYRDDDRFADYFRPARTNNSWSVWIQYYGDSPAVSMRLDFTAADQGVFYHPYFRNAPAYIGDFLIRPLPIRVVTAPQHLTKIQLLTNPGGVIGADNYIVDLSGESSGVFTIQNRFVHGVLTYQPSGAYAHLRMVYQGEYAGDFDDVTLDFDRLTFTGNQAVGSDRGQMSGSFTFTQ
jgi:hypothetical protein